MQAALVLAAPNGRILAVFGDTVGTFAWKTEDLVGESLEETIIPPRYRNEYPEGLLLSLTKGETPILRRPLSLAALGPDGSERPVWLTVFGQDTYTKCFFALVEARDG